MPLLAALNCQDAVHLVVGPASPLAASRCAQSLAAGAASVILVGPLPPNASLQPSLQALYDAGRVRHVSDDFRPEMLSTLGRPEVGYVVDAVFVADPKSVDGELPLSVLASLDL